ncbi:MAG: methylenetetrahydrofolate reductase [NAD(P)H] [Lachnospiraceae bacterium]|nr:methylenetetrahydrofolate reductase [NAD(P)H] [Lachnospiraceae bacterium]
MKISELHKSKKFSLSFEVFPPKDSDNYQSVKHATEEIAKLKPAFMSVTYGTGKGTSSYTLEMAKMIKEQYDVSSIAHLTCISSTKDTVLKRIREFKEAGIENILALRGDIPKDLLGADRSDWDYHYATDLIADIKKIDEGFCIGGACYPEIHPESENQREDIKHLKEKVDAGCDFLTTQMFFDNNLLYNFLYKIREAGILVPIVAGVMPITNAKQVERARQLSGSFMPQRFITLVDAFGSDKNAMKQAGIAYATDQVIDLYANGITNVHIYTMNHPDVAAAIQKNVSDILGKEL